jgi:hypothetical protein
MDDRMLTTTEHRLTPNKVCPTYVVLMARPAHAVSEDLFGVGARHALSDRHGLLSARFIDMA